MFTNRSFYLLIVTVLLVITACAPQVAVTPTTQLHSEPLTLRLAVADPEGRPSDPYVREFIEQVNMLSNGSITVEPIWNAALLRSVSLPSWFAHQGLPWSLVYLFSLSYSLSRSQILQPCWRASLGYYGRRSKRHSLQPHAIPRSRLTFSQ